MGVRGKFLAKELPSRKESAAHSPRGMVVPPPKLFPELTQVSLLAGYLLMFAESCKKNTVKFRK